MSYTFTVVTDFFDKRTKGLHRKGEVLELSAERAKEIKAAEKIIGKVLIEEVKVKTSGKKESKKAK